VVSEAGSEPVYGIGAVARMLGVTQASLRAWDERYGVVVPTRSSGGHRVYSRDQLDQLRYLLNLLDSGLQAAEAHRVLSARLAEGTVLVPSIGRKMAGQVLILLAERDLYAAELIEYLLRTEGYEVVVALDPTDAVVVYRTRRPDLVFVELVVSGRSGLELCRELSGLGATVVGVSALAIGPEAIDVGAAAFLLKPLDPLQVLSTVKELLGQSARVRPAPIGAST
jgi:DNA-binding transcriptional MerR regulator